MADFVDDDIGPFECPICFNRYDANEHVPCTLPCGHSLCISHVPALSSCPVCRAPLPGIDDIHASISLRDAILGVSIPLIEIHLSNIYGREEFREKSYFSDIALGVVSGFGKQSYLMAFQAAKNYLLRED